jgi:hypothetical protein
MSDTLAFSAHPAKLPEIATEDLKAIRGFLPGKLLGRTAALLSLALSLTLAYLEYFGPIHGVTAVGEKLGLTSHSWYQDGVVFGLPFLTVAAQSFNEWRAKSAERTLKTLATRDGAEQSGYFRIGPYLDTADDQKKFDRADRAHVRVLDWIERSANVPLYLTGDSGSGKTSLLNAFVLPTLRERGWTVIEARAWQDPGAALRSALAEGSGTRRSRLAGGNLCDMIQTAARRAPAGLLLVLDQFEEFVILGKPEQQREFAALVADLSRSQIKGLGLLVVLRSDYQAFLEDIGLPLPRNGDNLYQVARFTLAAASGFMNRSGLDLQANDLDRLLSTAAELDETPGLVRPITLNVVGYVLAANHGTALSLDAGQLVRRYIEQTVGQPAIRDFAPRILECLITEQGTKQPRSERELVTATGMRRGEVRAVLNGLGSAALARPLDPAQGVWELSHDFIARAVARYLGRRRRNVLRHGAFYAAPVILAITLTGAVSATGLQRWDQTQISSELTGLGLSVMPKGEQLEVEANHLLTPESFAKTAVALSKLSSRIHRVVIKATEWGPELKPIDISNLAPLSGLVALERLELSRTRVEDLAPLKGLTALQYLDLSMTEVRDLEPLERLTRLETLGLDRTKVHSLHPLRGLTALQQLELLGTRVEDLEPLNGLMALRILDVSRTEVKSVDPLKGLTALEELNLSGTKVQDIWPLIDLRSLQRLELSRTKVQNIEPLRGLSVLQFISLPDEPIIDLSPLQDLRHLEAIGYGEQTPPPEAEKNRFLRYRQEQGLSPVQFQPASTFLNASRPDDSPSESKAGER